VSQTRIAVIGAGIIGLCSAYYLQKVDNQVVLIDKQEPGTGTSRGHASITTSPLCHGREINSVYSINRYLSS